MTTVIAFILMFGLLVSVHEWGHLIFAKRAGMLAREFAIGFGPKIFSFTKNETLYTIRLIPAGGYVRVAGDDPEIIELKPGHHIGLEFNDEDKVNRIIVNNKDKHPNAQLVEVSAVDLDHKLEIEAYNIGEDELQVFSVDPKAFFIADERETQIAPYDRQFASKTVGQRAMQLFAGPLMNFILAIGLFLIIGMVQGVPAENALIGEVKSDSAAASAGIEAGDEVIEVEGDSVSNWMEFTSAIQAKPNEEVEVIVQRGEHTVTLMMTPNEVENELGDKVGQAGVLPGFEKSFFGSFLYGFEQTYDLTRSILTNIGLLITGQLSIEMLAGPVGIYDVTDQVVHTGIINMLLLTAMLSVNLGIMNLLPFPALDGGRLLFIVIELIRGKPITQEKEGFFHLVGFALLILLMLVVTWNDIQRLFN